MPSSDPPRVLWSLGGVGLGNATRGEAVLDALPGDIVVHVQGFGHARTHLRGIGRDVLPLRDMVLGDTALAQILDIPRNLLGFAINLGLSTARILRLRPDVVVVDSEYSAVLPALLLGCRLVALNHAAVIVRWWPTLGTPEHAWSYWSREVPDAALCRLAHAVIVPCLVDTPGLPPRHVAVPPIVRALPPVDPSRPREGWLVMRGGSTATRPLRLPDGAAVDDVGGAKPVRDTLARLARADRVVCHAGLSSLSEVSALGCRAAVVPLAQHAEQAINARLLARAGRAVVAEDGDVTAVADALDALQVEPIPDPEAGAHAAAKVVVDALGDARRPRDPGDTAFSAGTVAALLLALVAVSVTDVGLLTHGIIKLEQANAVQLATHALVRDGLVVVASAGNAYAEALHHAFFHPILAWTPRLDHVAAVLNVQYWLAAGLLGWTVGRRLGPLAGAVAGVALLAAPVSPILSKHVIPTAIVPVAAAPFVGGVLDVAAGHGRRALGVAVAALAVLVALNNGHAWLALPLGWAAWRAGVARPPAWSLALSAVALAPAVVRRVWQASEHGVWIGLSDVGAPPYDTVALALRRLILVEPHMHRVFPNLWLLLLLPLPLLALLWTRRDAVPRGLPALIAAGPLLWFAHIEATVVWQVVLCTALGWAATQARWMRGLVLAHCVSTPAVFGVAALGIGLPPADFFTLSLLRTRDRMLDVLDAEIGLRAAEFETLSLVHPEGEPGIANALTPGVAYLVDRVRPPLAPGGDRCVEVSDPDHPAPAGVALEQDHVDGVLRYRAWRTPAGCDASPRLPTDPVLVWDTRAGTLREVRP